MNEENQEARQGNKTSEWANRSGGEDHVSGQATETRSQGCEGVRAQASRRTAEGKFTKIVFNQIVGKGRRRFAAMTRKERVGPAIGNA